MNLMESLLASAVKLQKTIVLPEGSEHRVVQAAAEAVKKKIAKVVLIGNEEIISTQMAIQGVWPDDGFQVEDPLRSPLFDDLAALYYELRKHKGISLDDAVNATREPHVFAALMVKKGLADGMVGGAITPTGDIVRTAIQVIGKRPDAKLVSSFFLMLLSQDHHEKKGVNVFADGGLVVDPTAEEMAEIAIDSAANLTKLTGETPRVAMLSFSTHGSAKHPAVSKVVEATKLAKAAAPELLLDGELQFDAAFVPGVAQTKAPDSPLGGNANVFVFPNLDSGNIAYKIAQRIGGAFAIGPILQGLAKPANDLSRGCSVDDIIYVIAVTAAQAAEDAGA